MYYSIRQNCSMYGEKAFGASKEQIVYVSRCNRWYSVSNISNRSNRKLIHVAKESTLVQLLFSTSQSRNAESPMHSWITQFQTHSSTRFLNAFKNFVGPSVDTDSRSRLHILNEALLQQCKCKCKCKCMQNVICKCAISGCIIKIQVSFFNYKL